MTQALCFAPDHVRRVDLRQTASPPASGRPVATRTFDEVPTGPRIDIVVHAQTTDVYLTWGGVGLWLLLDTVDGLVAATHAECGDAEGRFAVQRIAMRALSAMSEQSPGELMLVLHGLVRRARDAGRRTQQRDVCRALGLPAQDGAA